VNAASTERTPRIIIKSLGLALAIVLLGAGLRFYAIGRKSLWLDEAVTVNLMGSRYTDMLAGVIGHDAHPPLYYALAHLWTQRSASALRARAFSAVFGVATVAVFYLLARVLLPREGALVATLLLAVSAFQVYFAQEARHYALAAFFVTLSWYFFVQLVAGRKLENWRWWLGLSLANAAALYTFYFTLFAVVAQLIVLVLLWRGIGKRLVVGWLSWQLLPAVLFALYVPVILEHIASLQGLAPPKGLTMLSGHGLMLTASQFACGFLPETWGSGEVLLRAATAALGILTLAAGFVGLRGCRCATAVTVTWLLGPIACLALLPIRGHAYEPKHLIAAAPAFALLPAIALVSSRGLVRGLAAALVAVLIATNGVSLWRYYDGRVEKENWRGAVAEVIKRVEPGDIVVFNPFYVRHPFHYYYQGHYREYPIMGVEAPASGEAFRSGELKLGRRIWLIEGSSRVAVPNPAVVKELSPHRLLFGPERFEGLVGSITVSLYDTFKPPPKGEAPAGPKGGAH